MRYLRAAGFILLVAVAGGGCAANEENGESLSAAPADGPALHTDVPTYTFLSRLNGMSVENGVAVGGQIARHAVIDTLKTHIAGVTGRIDNDDFAPSEGDLLQALELFFDCGDGMCDSEIVALSVEDDLSQARRSDISTATRLVDQIAGHNPVGQHRDWEFEFRGWSNDSSVTPESLVRMWFSTLDAAAVARANGLTLLTPSGEPLNQVYVTAEGLDLNQLIQKFLLGAITFSQATDDYLDDDLDGRGLNASNIDRLEGRSYTALRHNWDEAFGCFGAAREALKYADDDRIHLISEFDFGHGANVAQRGGGRSTDLIKDAVENFYAGRELISMTTGRALTTAEMETLKLYRDEAVAAWEKSIAATVIHSINDVIADMESTEYDFYEHAKHWSEMKGLALSFQFNPHALISEDLFVQIHQAMGTAPNLRPDSFSSTISDLLEVRSALGEACSFTMDAVENW